VPRFDLARCVGQVRHHDLDYTPNTARDLPVEIAFSNSFGFGGHNTAVVFQRCPSEP
jgi:3-oxoacyl-(acyl-carrier-protein) synthase